jgi:hypothetical protein
MNARPEAKWLQFRARRAASGSLRRRPRALSARLRARLRAAPATRLRRGCTDMALVSDVCTHARRATDPCGGSGAERSRHAGAERTNFVLGFCARPPRVAAPPGDDWRPRALNALGRTGTGLALAEACRIQITSCALRGANQAGHRGARGPQAAPGETCSRASPSPPPALSPSAATTAPPVTAPRISWRYFALLLPVTRSASSVAAASDHVRMGFAEPGTRDPAATRHLVTNAGASLGMNSCAAVQAVDCRHSK